MNIKNLLIERERVEWIKGNVLLSDFFSRTLDYIILLEENINTRDRAIEDLQEKLNGVNSREKGKEQSNVSA